MVALSKSFITATPSYCSCSRSCARERDSESETSFNCGPGAAGRSSWEEQRDYLVLYLERLQVHAHELGLHVKYPNSLRRGNLKNNVLEPAEEKKEDEVGELSKEPRLGGFAAVRGRSSLVGLQVLDGDQHALLMQPRGRVLLGHLLALLGFGIARLLGQPEKTDLG